MAKLKKNKAKKQDLAGQSVNELKKILQESKEEWVKLKMDLAVGRLKDVHGARKKQKEIARIKTILRIKELKDK